MEVAKYFEKIIFRNKNSDEYWCTYLFFAVLRLVLVFIPQLGYVHPDEFFQSTEIFVGEHFELEYVRSWEFNNTFPLRSVGLAYITLKVPLAILEIVSVYIHNIVGMDILCSYTYLVYPRLVMCILSFVNDWCLYKVCRLYSLRYRIRLLAMGSSYVMIIFSTRTFSNSIEMALTSALLYLVAECMIHSNTILYKKEFLEDRYGKAESIVERVKIWKLKNALPAHNYNRLFLISSLCVAGIFNRPTFLLFGTPIVFFWMLRGMGTRSVSFKEFNFRIILFCLSALPAIFIFTLIDSFYYKYLTLGELHMLDVGINNFVFTPWNFIKYNIDPSNTSQHGVHPKYLHMLINIPLLYNVLGVIALISFGRHMFLFLKGEYNGLPRAQSIVGLMSAAIFTPLICLSCINHQEPRFLIPITFPIILLHSPKLITGLSSSYSVKTEQILLKRLYKTFSSQKFAKYLLKTWYTVNIILVIFYGFVHQAGLIPLAQHIEKSMQTKAPNENIHLITSHVYSLPMTLINTPSTNVLHLNRETGQRYRKRKDLYIYEYGSMHLDKVLLKLKIILSYCERKVYEKNIKYSLYLAIPASLSFQLSEKIYTSNITSVDYEIVKVFYPHLSTEAFPDVFGAHTCDLHPVIDELDGVCEVMSMHGGVNTIHYLSRQFSSFIHQFGLVLYKFNVNQKVNL